MADEPGAPSIVASNQQHSPVPKAISGGGSGPDGAPGGGAAIWRVASGFGTVRHPHDLTKTRQGLASSRKANWHGNRGGVASLKQVVNRIAADHLFVYSIIALKAAKGCPLKAAANPG